MIEDNQGDDYDLALKMAIESLKQEPCEDCALECECKCPCERCIEENVEFEIEKQKGRCEYVYVWNAQQPVFDRLSTDG